ncbi:MAG: SIS domain-containing protein [Phycisphaerales bacterium]|nr:SIS domain-containing protein [Phycisphaerales bacterium]
MSHSSSPISSKSTDMLLARLRETTDALNNLEHRIPDIVEMGEMVIKSLAGGGTLFTAGNGGSAAQALHLTEELIGRYKKTRPPIRSICLACEASAMTCIANDFGFDSVFERPLRGLARTGDVLLVLSTSGNSANIVQALTAAREMGLPTLGLLGRDGGHAIEQCDRSIIVDGQNSATIQDAHQVIIHFLCELIEDTGN